MVKFINRFGGITLVDESRVDEYKAAGFKPVADSKPKEKAPAKKTQKEKKDK